MLGICTELSYNVGLLASNLNTIISFSTCTHTSLSLFTTQIDIHIQISPNYKHSSKSFTQYIIIMVSFKQLVVNWLLITSELSGTRLASARREYLGGSSSTKDDGGKHLRALPAPNQEGIEGVVLGSTSKNHDEVQVSNLYCLI